MKHALPAVFFFFSFLVSLPAQYLTSKDSDPEAISLLTKAVQSFSNKNAQINFKLKITQPTQEPITSEGILYQAGKSYHLDLKDYSITSDGKTRWVYFKGPNEVNIYNETSGQDWISPQDFLKLHTATDLVFMSAGTRADGVSIIEAKPLENGRFEEYSKFTIGIKNQSLSFINGISSDGMRQEMSITSVTFPTTWDAKKLFTFDASSHPGCKVEDLRLD